MAQNMLFVKFLKSYYRPKYLLLGTIFNLGCDYYNNKILGKINIIDSPNIEINRDKIKNLCIKEYRIETFFTTINVSIILGPLTTLSYMHDIYKNYKIRREHRYIYRFWR